MIRAIAIVATLLVCATTACTVARPGAAQSSAGARVIDLTRAGALEELRQTNPHHFEIIREIIAGLLEQPARAEGEWLQVNFDATDVDLTRLVMMTSYPPRQHLSFTLEDVRYRFYLTRSDLAPAARPVR